MPRQPRPPSNVTPLTHHTAVVQSTGEVIELTMSGRIGRRRKAKRKMFALMDIEALDALELSGAEWDVLFRIIRSVNPETNQAQTSVAQIAEDVGMDPSNVSKVMRRLRDRRIVFSPRPRVHRVNAHIAYRGSNADWDIATDTEQEPIWERA